MDTISNWIARKMIEAKIYLNKKKGKSSCDFMYPLVVFENNKKWMQANGYKVMAFITCNKSWCMSFCWRVSW